jgi:hypothetical protein
LKSSYTFEPSRKVKWKPFRHDSDRRISTLCRGCDSPGFITMLLSVILPESWRRRVDTRKVGRTMLPVNSISLRFTSFERVRRLTTVLTLALFRRLILRVRIKLVFGPTSPSNRSRQRCEPSKTSSSIYPYKLGCSESIHLVRDPHEAYQVLLVIYFLDDKPHIVLMEDRGLETQQCIACVKCFRITPDTVHSCGLPRSETSTARSAIANRSDVEAQMSLTVKEHYDTPAKKISVILTRNRRVTYMPCHLQFSVTTEFRSCAMSPHPLQHSPRPSLKTSHYSMISCAATYTAVCPNPRSICGDRVHQSRSY